MDYIVNPLGKLVVWTFDVLLVPIGDLGVNPNTIFIVMGFFGLFYWLRSQSKYNKEAEQNGTLQ